MSIHERGSGGAGLTSVVPEAGDVSPLVGQINGGNWLPQAEAEALRAELYFQRAVHAYLTMLPALNVIGMRDGSQARFGEGYHVLPVWKDRMDSRTWVPTPNADVIYSMGYLDLAATGPMVVNALANVIGMFTDFFQRTITDVGAQDYYRLSLRAAHAGGDRLWGANVLAGMARQMLYNGRPHDALELVRLAQEGSRGVAGPRVRAMLRTREAWAMAALGRTTAFERATELARQDLADASADEPYWIGYFDDAELTGTTGGRLLELARQNPRLHAERAGGQIRAALARRGPEAGRSHVLDRLGLAEVYFLCGDLVSGCAQTHAALDAGGQMHSARVREGMAHLYSYTVGHGASPTVREARSRLREHLAD